MKTYKPLLLLTLLIWSSLGHAINYSCIRKDDTIAPSPQTYVDSAGVTQFTDEMKAWQGTHTNWSTSKDWGCCEKLVLNASSKVCEDKAVLDSEIKSCSDHTECPSNKGCLTWREEDMFDESRVSSEAEKEALTVKAEEFEKAREEYDELSPDGGFCFTNMQCESYKCSGMQCKKNLICRLATETDPPTPTSVKCEEPYLKNNSGKCENPNSTYYNGLIGDIYVVTSGAGQCQFELQPSTPGITSADIPRAINLAIVTTRAAEWLYSTLSEGSSMSERDCVYSKDYFRDQMKVLVTERKGIIKDFNRDYKVIEDNFAIIQSAKQDDMATVQTLCDDTVTKHDIAMRKATGKDFLCYMSRRNDVFFKYETSMFDWTTKFNAVFTNYETELKNWGEKDKHWAIPGKAWDWKEARTCRHWVDLLVGVITPKRLKNRWISRFRDQVSSQSEMFNTYIDTIGIGGNAHNLKKWHWVLDPLSPGQKNMTVENFVKSLRDSEIPENEFIHEPEIASSYELRGCINKVNSPECARYKEYLKDLEAVAVAQKMMYSHHTKRKFKDYYKNEGSSRRRLLSRYVTDASNLLNYYEASTSLRTKQNECIDRVLNQLDGDFNNSEGTGVVTGLSNYYQGTSTNYAGANGSAQNYNTPKIKQSTGTPTQFNIKANTSSFKGIANKDGTTSSTTAGSGAIDAGAGSALAARNKALQEQNNKLAAKGTDVKKMNEDLMTTLGSKSSGFGSPSASNNSGSPSSASSASGKKATLDEDVESKGSQVSSVDPNLLKGTADSGIGAAGALSGIVGGSGSGYGSSSGSGNGSGAASNPTGLSDEEKDIMAANYDRRKSEYKTSEDDSLFQVLSKTYVRNLDKILTRKKKLDEGSASFPSEPSKP
jgi:hypothetical protein